MIPAPNYTQIPNILLDSLMMDLSHLELKILLFICRKTFGWHKIRDHISLSQFENTLHGSRSHIKEALDSLQEKKLIIKTQTGSQSDGSLKNYYELVVSDPGAQSAPPPGAQNATTPSAPEAPTKETSTKEKKIVCPSPPVGAQDVPKVVEKICTDGKKIRIEKDDVYRKAVAQNKDWSPAEITDVWKILVDYTGYVNDPWAFIEGTIKNLRSKINLEKLNKPQKQETKCHHHMGEPGRAPTKEEIAMLTRPSHLHDYMQEISKE